MRKNNRIMRGIVLLCGIVLLFGGAWGATNLRAKYVTSITLTGSVDFSPLLATDLTLQEHVAERKADGSYQLKTTTAAVNQNAYKVMPGVDIPKDPFITVTERTTVPGYLYVEVIDSLPDTVTYRLTNNWSLLSGVTGKNGGSVYVYVGSDLTVSPTTRTIEILNGNIVTVSDQYAGESFSLSFYACLYKKNENETASATFARVSQGT